MSYQHLIYTVTPDEIYQDLDKLPAFLENEGYIIDSFRFPKPGEKFIYANVGTNGRNFMISSNPPITFGPRFIVRKLSPVTYTLAPNGHIDAPAPGEFYLNDAGAPCQMSPNDYFNSQHQFKFQRILSLTKNEPKS